MLALLIRCIGICLSIDVVAESLDKHQGFGISWQRISNDQFSDDVKSFSGT